MLKFILNKALGLALVFLPLSLHAQIGMRTFQTKVAAADQGIGNIGSGIGWHQISWNVVGGTLSACDVKLSQSSDDATWSDLISDQDCTSNGMSAVVTGTPNYIQINVDTFTSSGGTPTVVVHWNGWNASPSGGGAIMGCTSFGGVLYQNGTNNTATCDGNLVWIPSIENLNIDVAMADGGYSGLNIQSTGNPTYAGDFAALIAETYPAPTADIDQSYYGVFGQSDSVGGSSKVTKAIGVFGQAQAGADVGAGTADTLVGVQAKYEIGAMGVVNVAAYGMQVLSPAYVAGATYPPIVNGIDIQDQNTPPTGSYTSTGLHIEAQSNGGKAIVEDSGAGENDLDIVSTNKCIAGCILIASLTTTAATSDNVAITGMTSSGHCSLTPTNATAIGLATLPYISAKTTNQITVTHAVTASATFDILCTLY